MSTPMHQIVPRWAMAPAMILAACTGFLVVAPVSMWVSMVPFALILVLLAIAAIRSRRTAPSSPAPNFIRFASWGEMSAKERFATVIFPLFFGYIVFFASAESWALAVPAAVLGAGAAWATLSGAADGVREDTVRLSP